MAMLRSLARCAPRTARSLAMQSNRSAIGRCQLARQFHQPWRPATSLRSSISAFSTSSRWRQSEGQVNEELAAKIDSELALERDMRDPDELPPILQEYLDNSPFQLDDTPGKEEVVMTRQFGDENIRITFSIVDLNNADQDLDEAFDNPLEELGDEGIEGDAPGKAKAINQPGGGKGPIPVAPEDRIAPADRADLADEPADDATPDEGEQPSFPAHVHVTVERPGKGALQIEAIAQDGLMVIDNVSYFRDANMADPRTTDAQFAGRDLYRGPPFGNLDEDLQVLMEKYLDERGVNTAMALFVPEYIDYKEQREYLSWLEGVKNFVE